MIQPGADSSRMSVSWRAVAAAAAVVLAVSWSLDTGSASAQMMPVGVGLTADAQKVTVGDVFTLTLSVSHPDDHHIVFPEVPSEWGDFEVRRTTHLPTEVDDDGTLISAVRIEAALFAPGIHSTPALSVAVRRPDGTVINRPARPIDIVVASVLAEGANELRGIRPQAEVPFPVIWPWAVGGAMTLAMLVLLGGYYWRQRAAEQTLFVSHSALTPLEAALEALDRIQMLDLPAESRYTEHYALVADCLRSYLFGQFRIPAPELTSEQSVSVLDRRPVSPTDVGNLASILEEADLVKFARLTPEPQEAHQTVVTARRVVTGLTAAPSRFRPAEGYTSGRYTR